MPTRSTWTYMFGTIASAIGTLSVAVGPIERDALGLDDAAAAPRHERLGRIERRLQQQLGGVAAACTPSCRGSAAPAPARPRAPAACRRRTTQNVILVWFGRPLRVDDRRGHLVRAALLGRERARHRILRRGHRAGLRIDLLLRVLALLVLPVEAHRLDLDRRAERALPSRSTPMTSMSNGVPFSTNGFFVLSPT